MVMNKLLIKISLLCLIIFSLGLLPVYAQEPAEEEAAVEPIVVAPSGQLNLTLQQLGQEAKTVGQGNTTVIYRVDLPGNFQIRPSGNYLDLITSHFPPNPEGPVSLQVLVNDELLSTFPLTSAIAISSTTQIDLPPGVLKVGGNNTIRVNLEGAGGTCENPAAPLNVVIDENSTLSFGYQQVPYPADLGLYPFPFNEASLLSIPVTIVLPDQPTATDLSAAATIAAGLGQKSKGVIDLTAVQAAELTPEIQNNSHLIVLGQPNANSLLDELDLPLPISDANVQPGQGILQEVVSPWNEFRLVLVVSGLDDEGLAKASNALNRQANFLGMRGPVAVVIDLLPLAKPTAPKISTVTLADLGYVDEITYGATPKEYSFDFTLPLGWRLEETPIFALKFAHADILDPNESVIDVKFNGMPVSSALLDDSNASEGELLIPLPTHKLKNGRNRLEVTVQMRLAGGDPCLNAADRRAWTVISSASEISLPYDTVNLLPDLGFFPYPFSQNSGFDQTVFVLPDEASSESISQLVQLAARLGSATAAQQIAVEATYAAEVDEAMRDNHHLIVLGRPTQNSLLREINAHLPQPFITNSDLLEPLKVDSVAFLADPNRAAGLLEIAPSPWDDKFSVLVIAGTTDQGVDLAVQTLLDKTAVLEGNLAVVEPVFDPLSPEANQISTFSIDTRPPAILNDDEASIIRPISKTDEIALAQRWWK
jgi:hypothetical protein